MPWPFFFPHETCACDFVRFHAIARAVRAQNMFPIDSATDFWSLSSGFR